MTVVVYHWISGAYVNSLYWDFEEAYAELCAQYGPPTVAMTLDRKSRKKLRQSDQSWSEEWTPIIAS